jgi:hypothetical protein
VSPGLNGLEVFLAAVNASALTPIAVLALRRVDPTVSLFSTGAGAFLGFLAVFLAVAARRPPRLVLTWRDRLVCVVSGLSAGTFGVVALMGA